MSRFATCTEEEQHTGCSVLGASPESVGNEHADYSSRLSRLALKVAYAVATRNEAWGGFGRLQSKSLCVALKPKSTFSCSRCRHARSGNSKRHAKRKGPRKSPRPRKRLLERPHAAELPPGGMGQLAEVDERGNFSPLARPGRTASPMNGPWGLHRVGWGLGGRTCRLVGYSTPDPSEHSPRRRAANS